MRWLRGLWRAYKLPQWVRVEPAEERILVHFRHKFAPFGLLNVFIAVFIGH